MPTCRHAVRVMDRHLVEFGSLAETAEAGYRACRVLPAHVHRGLTPRARIQARSKPWAGHGSQRSGRSSR